MFRQGATALNPDLLAEVEQGVTEGSSHGCERKTIGNGEDGRKEERRVGLVLLDVKSIVGAENTGDVVVFSGVVVRVAGQNREMLGIPGVAELKRGEG